MTDLITTLDSYCKKLFVTYRFDNCRKHLNIMKYFFLFISMSYPLYLIIQNMSKPIFLQFETPFLGNDIGSIWGAYSFPDTIFYKRIILFFYSYLLFRPIMPCHSFLQRCWLICFLIIYIGPKYAEYLNHMLVRSGRT